MYMSSYQIAMQHTYLMTYTLTLTFGSNLNEAAVRKAARPSFRTTANPPTRGEYSISMTYVLHSRIGTAANHRTKNVFSTKAYHGQLSGMRGSGFKL